MPLRSPESCLDCKDFLFLSCYEVIYALYELVGGLLDFGLSKQS